MGFCAFLEKEICRNDIWRRGDVIAPFIPKKARPIGCFPFEVHRGGIMAPNRKGFFYRVTERQTMEYRAWPIARRLEWLLSGNKLRKSLPEKTILIQDAFRKGEK